MAIDPGGVRVGLHTSPGWYRSGEPTSFGRISTMLFARRQLLLAIPALLASTVAVAQQKTVKIGAALSMTGAAAAYGANQKNGVMLAVEEINASNFIPGVKLE